MLHIVDKVDVFNKQTGACMANTAKSVDRSIALKALITMSGAAKFPYTGTFMKTE